MSHGQMDAMVFTDVGRPMALQRLPIPRPDPDGVLIRVEACGVCRTDLHVVDGELAESKRPLVPGHQIIGIVEETGSNVSGLRIGDRLGVPWLGGSCGVCAFCRCERENLCDQARFTGYQIDGGFAQYCVADQGFCFPIPERFSALQAAPLLCAGLIGYRAWRPARDAETLGLYGFGAAAHILIQTAVHVGQKVFAFTRPGDSQAQSFARELGAVWAGSSLEAPESLLDAAIIFAPVGSLVPRALRALRKGGRVICAGIHMSDIPAFPYADLWGERSIQSIANLTRRDGESFLPLAAEIGIETRVTTYPLDQANRALDDLRGGRLTGAAVIEI